MKIFKFHSLDGTPNLNSTWLNWPSNLKTSICRFFSGWILSYFSKFEHVRSVLEIFFHTVPYWKINTFPSSTYILSGQLIIIHQPRFPWNQGSHFPSSGRVRIAIVSPDRISKLDPSPPSHHTVDGRNPANHLIDRLSMFIHVYPIICKDCLHPSWFSSPDFWLPSTVSRLNPENQPRATCIDQSGCFLEAPDATHSFASKLYEFLGVGGVKIDFGMEVVWKFLFIGISISGWFHPEALGISL